MTSEMRRRRRHSGVRRWACARDPDRPECGWSTASPSTACGSTWCPSRDGQAAGASRRARGGGVGPGRPRGHGARRQPAVDGAGRPEGGELCAFVREPSGCRLPALRGGGRFRRPGGDRHLVGGPVRGAGAARYATDGRSPGSRARRACPARWSSPGCPSPRRSRTGCTGTSGARSTSCSRPAPRLLRAPDDEISWDILADPGGQRVLRLRPR